MTYDEAVVAISDLGLRLTLPCRDSVTYAPGATGLWVRWESVEQKLNFDPGGHKLWVAPTPLAPADWLRRLQTSIGVRSVSTSSAGSCPQHIADATPMPGTPYYLSSQQVNDYARIVFSANSTIYQQDVAAINQLGLRLADPCYEQATQRGETPPGHDLGQEKSFAAMHVLVVATTADASDQWQIQLRSLPGVQKVESITGSQCA